jgi:hypothetical protein
VFKSENMIPPLEGLCRSVIEDDTSATSDSNNSSDPTKNSTHDTYTTKTKTFATVLKMMEGALVGFIEYADFKRYTETNHIPIFP